MVGAFADFLDDFADEGGKDNLLFSLFCCFESTLHQSPSDTHSLKDEIGKNDSEISPENTIHIVRKNPQHE